MKKILFLASLSAFLFTEVSAQSCPPLNPANDNTGIAVDLLLSEINPGDYIELYNTTGTDIALSSVQQQLCSPFTYAALQTLAPAVVVPANGYATIPWPGFFTDTDAGGEVILFKNSNFSTSSNIIDFVCWGVNPHSSRKAQAEAVGKWQVGFPCAGAITGGSIHRIAGTDGTSASSYNVSSASSPLNCAPNPCAGVNCDDGNLCNGTETCDSLTGNCVAGTPLICNDVDECTTDGCNPSSGCTTVPLVCNDSDECTTDGCNPSSGCTTVPLVCNDSDECTTDGCNPSSGCTTVPLVCNDGDACTKDTCVNGVCGFSAFCDDGDICTDDSCVGGQCFFTTIPGCSNPCDTLNCNDNNLCTTDSCANSACLNTPIGFDDGDACTTDGCDSLTGCTTTAIVCDDNDACTTDGCDSLSGCFDFPVNCDDGDSCTVDSCVGGQCFNTHITGCGINNVNVHTVKGMRAKAYPNPFMDRLNIEFTLNEDSHAKLEIFSVTGQRLAELFDGDVTAGQLKQFEYVPAENCPVERVERGMVTYHLQTEQGTYHGKAVMVR